MHNLDFVLLAFVLPSCLLPRSVSARNMQLEIHPQPSRLSRKGKERDTTGPQPTDIDEKIMAHRRRNAA